MSVRVCFCVSVCSVSVCGVSLVSRFSRSREKPPPCRFFLCLCFCVSLCLSVSVSVCGVLVVREKPPPCRFSLPLPPFPPLHPIHPPGGLSRKLFPDPNLANSSVYFSHFQTRTTCMSFLSKSPDSPEERGFGNNFGGGGHPPSL